MSINTTILPDPLVLSHKWTCRHIKVCRQKHQAARKCLQMCSKHCTS